MMLNFWNYLELLKCTLRCNHMFKSYKCSELHNYIILFIVDIDTYI